LVWKLTRGGKVELFFAWTEQHLRAGISGQQRDRREERAGNDYLGVATDVLIAIGESAFPSRSRTVYRPCRFRFRIGSAAGESHSVRNSQPTEMVDRSKAFSQLDQISTAFGSGPAATAHACVMAAMTTGTGAAQKSEP
jgi:hypothetical protein